MGKDTQQIVNGNQITWNVPMRFIGNLATPPNVKIMTEAMEKGWSGTYGRYHVTTCIVSAVKGYQTAVIAVDSGKYNPLTGENRSATNPGLIIGKDGLSGHWYFPGSYDDMRAVAKHELGHGLKQHGLIDRYHDFKGRPDLPSKNNRGFDNNIMGIDPNGAPRQRDIFTLIHNVPQGIQKLPGYSPRASGIARGEPGHMSTAKVAEAPRVSANPVTTTHGIADTGEDSGNFSQMPPHIP